MDSTRRHHLAENHLGKWLLYLYDDFYKPHSKLIIGVAVLLLLLLMIVLGTAWLRQGNRADQWHSFFSAMNTADSEQRIEELKTMADRFTTGSMAMRVRLTIGQIYLNEGTNLLFTDREKAIERLEKAVLYFSAAQVCSNDRLMREEITFKVAATYEALAAARTDKDDLAKAESKYKEAFTHWPNAVYAERAKQRYTALQRPDAKELLTLLATAKEETKPEDLNIQLEKGDKLDVPSPINLQDKLDSL